MIRKMEEYLQHMKTLRSQMNDVEDQVAKISVEEQMQITAIQSLEKDLDSAKSETKKFKEDAEKMMKERGQICSQILEKQRKIASLESDSSTLTQTLELIQQERVNLSTKLVEKRTYYTKVTEDIHTKLQQQQDWVKFHMGREVGEPRMVNEGSKNLMAKLDSAKAKLEGITEMKSKLVMENSKIRESIDQVKGRANNFKAEFLAMEIKTLEQEHEALLSDKGGETEYMQSLQHQIEKLKAKALFTEGFLLDGKENHLAEWRSAAQKVMVVKINYNRNVRDAEFPFHLLETISKFRGFVI